MWRFESSHAHDLQKDYSYMSSLFIFSSISNKDRDGNWVDPKKEGVSKGHPLFYIEV